MTSADANEKEKWADCPESILEFYVEPRTRVDLRRPLGAGDREALARLGLARPFAGAHRGKPRGGAL